jgi:hypothetical protein
LSRRFALTFDYLCPFARNANEHVVAGLRAGADWDVRFTPYSLAQGHVEPDAPDVWDRDDRDRVSGLLALQVGVAVRDHLPERFLDVHVGLFGARHDEGADIKDPDVLRWVLQEAGVDPELVHDLLADGRPLKTVREEHDTNVRQHEIWGVPTFVAGSRAVFVRLLDRPGDDAEHAVRSIENVLDLVEGAPNLHEFKQTDLPM